MDDGVLKQQLLERFNQLPKPVQQAISSADVQKRLRELATGRKLHVDQWDVLENEVTLALLGFEHPDDLEKNIQKNLSLSSEEARGLAQEINTVVFDPIRKELERQLEHPEAQEKQLTNVEAAREQLLGGGEQKQEVPAAPAPTPPAPKADANVTRAPASGAYKPGEASITRKSVTDDPYRELPQ